MLMAALYVVQTGKTACASAALKVAVDIKAASGTTCKLVAFDCTFDGTSATATPILLELVKESTASATTGSAFTPVQVGGGQTRTAQFTARINDTADGTNTSVLAAWLIPPTSGFSYQFPLGREVEIGPFGTAADTYLALRITTVAGSGTPNYEVNAWIEE